MRLDKFLSDAGLGTRSEVKHIIRKGRVEVNDDLVIKVDKQINCDIDVIKVDKQIINYKAFHYFVLNKPKGYVSANTDDSYPTVLDLFSSLHLKNLSHVGRLDLDTTGVLLITNDGKLGHFLISPKSNVEKIYELTVDKDLESSLIDLFSKGIKLENGDECKPAKLTIIDNRHAELKLTEGKYHQVKRMMRSVGYEVVELNRKQFAFLTVKNTKQGEYYELNENEINELKKYMR